MILSFEQLPSAVGELHEKLTKIEQLLIVREAIQPREQDQLLTVEQCATFLNLSKATVYGLISKGEIPVMKRSKRCYFSKSELVQYIQAGRKRTNSEIETEAKTYLAK